MSAHLLSIEDDSAISKMLSVALQRHGHIVHSTASVAQAKALLDTQKVDLAIIDWMMPGGSGLEFVRSLRKDPHYSHLPIIMLTAKTDEEFITQGLDAGADDYVTKPFSPNELQSRIKALLRRSADYNDVSLLTRGPLTIDLAAHRVTSGQSIVELGHTEFKLLAFLMQHPERVYSRAELLDHVWGIGTYIEERTVDVHVLRLRKSLKPFDADGLLKTVRGAGYLFSRS